MRREPRGVQDALEGALGDETVKRPPVAVHEHPRRDLAPPAAQRVRLALRLEAPEDADELLTQVDRSRVPAFRGAELAPGAQAPRDPHLASREVEVLPPQPEGLARAQPRPRHREPQGDMPTIDTGRRVEKPG